MYAYGLCSGRVVNPGGGLPDLVGILPDIYRIWSVICRIFTGLSRRFASYLPDLVGDSPKLVGDLRIRSNCGRNRKKENKIQMIKSPALYLTLQQKSAIRKKPDFFGDARIETQGEFLVTDILYSTQYIRCIVLWTYHG